jgi:hypothetical protein
MLYKIALFSRQQIMSTDIIENLFVQLLDSGRVITKKSTPSKPPISVKISTLASFVKIKTPSMWSVLTFDRVNVEILA